MIASNFVASSLSTPQWPQVRRCVNPALRREYTVPVILVKQTDRRRCYDDMQPLIRHPESAAKAANWQYQQLLVPFYGFSFAVLSFTTADSFIDNTWTSFSFYFCSYFHRQLNTCANRKQWRSFRACRSHCINRTSPQIADVYGSVSTSSSRFVATVLF